MDESTVLYAAVAEPLKQFETLACLRCIVLSNGLLICPLVVSTSLKEEVVVLSEPFSDGKFKKLT